MNVLLQLRNVQARYGKVPAVSGLSLEVPQGGFVSLLGANGAGKSTTLRVISGLLPAVQGQVLFLGQEISKWSSQRIVASGIVHVPEGRQVFPTMTVRENLQMGAFVRRDGRAVRQDLERVLGQLPRLKERLGQRAGTLSGGEQQMLAIGRALMARPKLLLLDEPSMGLSPKLVTDVFDLIKAIHAEGTAVLVVEQNANMALRVSQYAYILQNGSVNMSGESGQLLADDRVRRSYLGH